MSDDDKSPNREPEEAMDASDDDDDDDDKRRARSPVREDSPMRSRSRSRSRSPRRSPPRRDRERDRRPSPEGDVIEVSDKDAAFVLGRVRPARRRPSSVSSDPSILPFQSSRRHHSRSSSFHCVHLRSFVALVRSPAPTRTRPHRTPPPSSPSRPGRLHEEQDRARLRREARPPRRGQRLGRQAVHLRRRRRGDPRQGLRRVHPPTARRPGRD